MGSHTLEAVVTLLVYFASTIVIGVAFIEVHRIYKNTKERGGEDGR